jgi:hypothetical protein
MKKIFCFDLDNVICKTYKNFYSKSIPIKKNIKVINSLYDQGYIIKIFTARYMGRSNENIKIAKKKAIEMTLKQLKNWDVKYNKLIFGKPSFDIYIDDKNINFKSDWSNLIKKKYL